MRTVAAVRAGWGLALTVATRPLLRVMVRGEKPSGALVVFARTVGIRDLVFGTGCLLAASSPDGVRDLRRWLAVWLASDVADVAAGLTAARHLGRSGALAAAAAPLPFVGAGVWSLRRLPAG